MRSRRKSGSWNTSLDLAAQRLIASDIRAMCCRRKTAQRARCQGAADTRVELTPDVVDELMRNAIAAATYAALGPIPNKVRNRGAPPDNARIILAYDVCRALTDLGLSDGLHFESAHQSIAVELYIIIASSIWPCTGGTILNPRKTFARMVGANIVLN